jgi:hypothetical protein
LVIVIVTDARYSRAPAALPGTNDKIPAAITLLDTYKAAARDNVDFGVAHLHWPHALLVHRDLLLEELRFDNYTSAIRVSYLGQSELQPGNLACSARHSL